MSSEPLGREDLIDALRQGLERAPVVVLVGPAGIGKSTLATTIEASLWVRADGLQQADELVGRAARSLGLPTERPEAVVDALEALETVVIDGYDLGPHDLDDLLEAWSARVRVVVTSRVHLPRWSPHLEVGPLEPELGASVLRAHVRDPRRAASLDDTALRALSKALDGVPLALALVAERLRMYGPEQLLEKVRRLQESSADAGLARTLADALSLSLDSLSPAGRRALDAAVWLPGRFDITTLAAVVGEEVDEAVLELLDASLLHGTTASPPRLKVLAPVRAAVARQVDPAVRDEVITRLAAHVLPLAEDAARQGSLDALETLGRFQELLGAMTRLGEPAVRLRAALALAARERRTGPAQAILDRDGELPDEGPDELRVRWGLMVARTACGALQPDLAEQVLARIEPLVDDRTRSEERSARSFLALTRRDAAQAAALAREALAIHPDPSYHLRLGVALFDLGRQQEAAQAFQEARRDVDPFRRGHATYGLCTALIEQGRDAEDVLQLVHQAEAEGATDFPWLACRLEFLRGALLSDLARFDEAKEHLLRAADQHRLLGETPSQLFMQLNAYSLDFAARRVPQALLELSPEGGPFGQAVLEAWKAVTHAALGHVATAEAEGRPALEQLDALNPRQAREMRCHLAVALASRAPGLAASLLPQEGEEPLLERARALVAGEPVDAPEHLPEHILAGLAALTRQRAAIARDGSAFIGEDGERVDIARRKVLRRLLATLAASDGPMGVERLCAEVWPGQKLVGQSGTRRVHVAISTLRGLGLREAIETDVTGTVTTWRLDADVVDGL